jgi:probable rRNA maturation factor
MDVFFANEQSVQVDEMQLADLAQYALEAESVEEEAELSILMVDAGHMQRLNNRFADDNHTTDVLAFPMSEDEEDMLVLGDVVICPEVAQRNAQRYGHSLSDELELLLVHGILHLLGYDHQDDGDKIKMERRTRELLDSHKRSPAR